MPTRLVQAEKRFDDSESVATVAVSKRTRPLLGAPPEIAEIAEDPARHDFAQLSGLWRDLHDEARIEREDLIVSPAGTRARARVSPRSSGCSSQRCQSSRSARCRSMISAALAPTRSSNRPSNNPRSRCRAAAVCRPDIPLEIHRQHPTRRSPGAPPTPAARRRRSPATRGSARLATGMASLPAARSPEVLPRRRQRL